jgi:hypothetical protein
MRKGCNHCFHSFAERGRKYETPRYVRAQTIATQLSLTLVANTVLHVVVGVAVSHHHHPEVHAGYTGASEVQGTATGTRRTQTY